MLGLGRGGTCWHLYARIAAPAAAVEARWAQEERRRREELERSPWVHFDEDKRRRGARWWDKKEEADAARALREELFQRERQAREDAGAPRPRSLSTTVASAADGTDGGAAPL